MPKPEVVDIAKAEIIEIGPILLAGEIVGKKAAAP